jgi:single-strand DNA-binding protein
MSINEIVIEGRVGNDPRHIILDDGFQIGTFSLANNEYWKDKNTGDPVEKTSWFKVKGFNRIAEKIRDDIKKGEKIIVFGSMIENIWTDKNGNKRREHELIANKIRVMEAFTRRGDEKERGGDMGGRDQPPKEHNDSKFTVSDIPF